MLEFVTGILSVSLHQYQYQKSYFNWGTNSQQLLQRHPEHKTKIHNSNNKDNLIKEILLCFMLNKSISQ